MGAWEDWSSSPSWILRKSRKLAVLSAMASIPTSVMHPGQGEVVESRKAGLIDDGARHSGESGLGRD